MSVSKKQNRYNAYMKRTDTGIIVKTVDSVTGIESYIKFTTDSVTSTEKSNNDSSKENTNTGLKEPTAGDEHEKESIKNTKKKTNTTFSQKSNTIISNLKEIANVPNFHVYEDSSSSTKYFPNPNIIFVANSKLARENTVNLTIPAKLGNVCYNGVLNKNGIVKFKAETVVKPFTIIIGEYVINIRVCHSLKSDKSSSSKSQSKVDSQCFNNNVIKPLRKEKCLKTKETNTESKSNLIQQSKLSCDCSTQTDNTTTTIISQNLPEGLREKGQGESIKPPSSVSINNNKTIKLKCLDEDSKSTIMSQEHCNSQTESTVDDRSTEKRLSVKTYNSEQIKGESYSVRSLMSNQKSLLLESNSTISGDILSNARHSIIFNNCTPKSVDSIENLSEDTRNLYDSKTYNSCCRKQFTISETNSVSVHSELETKPLTEFGDEIIDEYESRPTQECSSVSLIQIKNKLSETTESLRKISSFINLIDSLSVPSISGEGNKTKLSSVVVRKKTSETCQPRINNQINSDTTNFNKTNKKTLLPLMKGWNKIGKGKEKRGDKRHTNSLPDLSVLERVHFLNKLKNYGMEIPTIKLFENKCFENQYQTCQSQVSETGKLKNNKQLCKTSSSLLLRDLKKVPYELCNSNKSRVNGEMGHTNWSRCLKVEDSKTSLGQVSEITEDQHHDAKKMFNKHDKSSKTEDDESVPSTIFEPAKSETLNTGRLTRKSFKRKIKQQYSTLKCQLKNFGNLYSRKRSDFNGLSENKVVDSEHCSVDKTVNSFMIWENKGPWRSLPTEAEFTRALNDSGEVFQPKSSLQGLSMTV